MDPVPAQINRTNGCKGLSRGLMYVSKIASASLSAAVDMLIFRLPLIKDSLRASREMRSAGLAYRRATVYRLRLTGRLSSPPRRQGGLPRLITRAPRPHRSAYDPPLTYRQGIGSR